MAITFTDERREVLDAACAVAEAIRWKDRQALASRLAPGFTMRTPGGPVIDATAFVEAVAAIPVTITAVRLESTAVDIHGSGALVTGVQVAEVLVDGEAVEDRRPFVDWFVRIGDEWLVRAALDLPPLGIASDSSPAAGT